MDLLARYENWAMGGPAVRRVHLPISEPEHLSPVLEAARGQRDAFIARFGFPAVFDETIAAMLPHGPFLEVGAGTGFLAAVLGHAGADCIATDPCSGEHGFLHGRWTTLQPLGGLAAVRRHPGRAVIMSWPSRTRDWGCRVVAAMPIGAALIHIGEWRGGCTGTHGLFDVLERGWRHVERLPLAQFPGMRDCADVFERVG